MTRSFLPPAAARARYPLLLAALAALAACGTPQEQCINAATRDLRVLDQLIAETEGNIARGYGYRETMRTEMRYVPCNRPVLRQAPPREPGAKPVFYYDSAPGFCWEDVPVSERRPVAVDLAAERAKLAEMRKKRAELNAMASAAVAQCRATYPE